MCGGPESWPPDIVDKDAPWRSPKSVYAFERFFQVDERLLGLLLPPQAVRPSLQLSLLLDAIVFDHLLDACGPIACLVMIVWHRLAAAFLFLSPAVFS